jgi:N-acetylmuramoyl-L-alanine amidase
MQSPEYPDLRFVRPKAWTPANRDYVQFLVIHDTEGSSHAQSAEDGAAYDARRTDGTSTHYFVDSNSVIQSVETKHKAHTARANGNRLGIHYELCAKASFPRSRWLDPAYGLPMLKLAAKQAARDCKKWNIPIRKITPAAAAAGTKGILGHGDVTRAFPQDHGTHTDPGPNFPWDEFISMVKEASGSVPASLTRKVDFVEFTVNMPVLKKGDTDDSIPGATTYVRRAQAMLAYLGDYDGNLDGDYGPKMADATKAMMKGDASRSSANGTVFGEPEWRRAFGAWK